MKKGVMYLTAIIDLHTRFVVGWSVSNSMDAEWCKQAVEQAIAEYGKPEIINTDQGSQFTSAIFTDYILNEANIWLSVDGKGRATDNAFIEQMWRSVKYEKPYLQPPTDGHDLWEKMDEYIHYYNFKRRHSAIEYRRPSELYTEQLKVAA